MISVALHVDNPLVIGPHLSLLISLMSSMRGKVGDSEASE